MNRASTIVRDPNFPKYSSDRSTYSCLKSREPGLNSDGPMRAPDDVGHLVAGHGGHEAADQDHADVQLALGGEQPGGEEEGVAGKEEDQARLGEDGDEKSDRSEGFDEVFFHVRGTIIRPRRASEAPIWHPDEPKRDRIQLEEPCQNPS